MPLTLTVARHLRSLLMLLAFTLLLQVNAYAGKGTFRKTGATTGVFDFCVSITFQANDTQLNKIKTVLQRASDVLADATEGQHRFGNVNIVNNGGALDGAEILILPGPGSAYVMQPAYGGWRNAINLYYTGDIDQPLGLEYSALVVLHEFGHSAYSLSEEYNGPRTETTKDKVIGCAPTPTPPVLPTSEDGMSYCVMDAFVRRGSRYRNWAGVFSIREFCVPSNHDPDGDTFQTAWHHASCWTTMATLHLQNVGFKRTWSLIPPTDLPSLAPLPSVPVNFGTACDPPKVVLLIDQSNSMGTNNRIVFAERAAEQFITFFPYNSYLSVVTFAWNSTVRYPLTQISNLSNKTNAISAVNSIPLESATNIGGGLQTALEQLKAQDNCPSCQKTIFLLSDGDHTTGPPPEAFIQDLISSNVSLVAIVLGNDISQSAEATLKNMTSQTGGQYYRIAAGFGTTPSAPPPSSPGSTDPNVSAAVDLGPSDLVGLYIRLAKDLKGEGLVKEQQDIVSSGTVKEIPVTVESGATSTTISLTKAEETDSVQLTLRKPSGEMLTESGNANVERISGPNTQVVQVKAPEPGTWKAVLTSSTVTAGKLETSAYNVNDGVHLNVRMLSDSVIDIEKMAVKAVPTYKGQAVVGAAVTGSVKRPDGTQVVITLFDDGLTVHGDDVAGDAEYSALFNNYSTDGTYTFDLSVQNVSGTTREGEALAEDGNSSIRPVPPLTRAGSATAILTGFAEGDLAWVDDAVPPGGVTSGEWYWVNANPGPVSGGVVHQSKITALSPYTVDEHSFVGATSKLPVQAGDRLFAYVFLDPNAVPDEIMLQWHTDDGWEHRAFWGADYIQLGANGTAGRHSMGSLPPAGRWMRLEVDASAVGLEGKAVDGMAFTTNGNRASWDKAGRVRGASPQQSTGDFPWLEDSVPAGSLYDNKDDIWDWVNIPGQYSGQVCHRSFLRGDTGTGRFRTHGFYKSPTPMQVESGDVLYTYVYIDPTYRPDEIVVQWYADDSWEHRAYWGNNFVDIGVTGTESRRYMGAIPQPASMWHRLEIPASYVGLEGKTVTGMSFGYYKQNDRARVSWDLAGKTSQPTMSPYPLSSLTPLWRFRADSYGYSYSTNDIGRAEQVIWRSPVAYVHPLQAAGTLPVYRFRDLNGGKYFYITRKVAPDPTWYYDGVAFYVYPQQVPGTVPMHQFYGRYSGSKQGYFYTTDTAEGTSLGMSYQGILGYVNTANPLAPVAPSDSYITGPNGMYWSDNSSNESGFEIEYLDSVDGWQPAGAVGPNVTSFSHIRMKVCGTLFRVRAFNGVGRSDYSIAQAGMFSGTHISFSNRCIYWSPESDPTPPAVAIVSPPEAATFKAGSNIQIAADAFDEQGNGTIAKVEVFDGGFKVGEATSPPYTMTLAGVTAGSHTLTATATDAGGLSSTSTPLTITVQPMAPGDIIISEFRFRGGGGQLDEFVELYNNTDFTVTVGTTDGSSGWSLVGSDGSVRFTIPNGTIISARAHYLSVNAGAYSLGAYTPADTEWLGDITDGAGVALFKSSNPSNFTTDYRLDAVGFSSVADARFREGAGLQPASGINANSEFSFLRQLNSSTPKDTNDNAADFLFISTDGITSGGVPSILGAPGPEGLVSPVQHNSSIGLTLLDPAVGSSSPPNRARDFTSDPANNSTFGTMSMRRTVTNNTGAPVTRLRFRITDMSTYPTLSGVADMRLRSSGAIQVTRVDGSAVPVLAMTLQTPPVQPNGGGVNSTVAVGNFTMAEPLQPGASVHVQFLLGLQSTGSFRFFINIEAMQ